MKPLSLSTIYMKGMNQFMPLPRARLQNLMDEGELRITPFDPSQLTSYGYNLHVGKIIKEKTHEDGYNTTVETYDIELKELLQSDHYSAELVLDNVYVQAGATCELGNTPIPISNFGKYMTIKVTQPMRVYIDQRIGEAHFSATEDVEGVPSGGIIAFCGTIIPYGWVLCNGENGTPDLRDRFILGSSGSIGETGGQRTITLDIPNLPMHSHSIASTTIREPVDGGTTRTVAYPSPGSYATGEVGSNRPIAIMDPYYRLAYIMKR